MVVEGSWIWARSEGLLKTEDRWDWVRDGVGECVPWLAEETDLGVCDQQTTGKHELGMLSGDGSWERWLSTRPDGLYGFACLFSLWGLFSVVQYLPLQDILILIDIRWCFPFPSSLCLVWTTTLLLYQLNFFMQLWLRCKFLLAAICIRLYFDCKSVNYGSAVQMLVSRTQ